MKKKQMLALLACILLCSFVAFSAAFIIAEADHDCVGEGCHICVGIEKCRSLLRGLAGALAASAVFLPPALCVISLLKRVQIEDKTVTPVTLKVKLLN